MNFGSGHFMRCLSLAKTMVSAGMRCRFVCRALPGHMADHVRARNIDVVLMPRLEQRKKLIPGTLVPAWLRPSKNMTQRNLFNSFPRNVILSLSIITASTKHGSVKSLIIAAGSLLLTTCVVRMSPTF